MTVTLTFCNLISLALATPSFNDRGSDVWGRFKVSVQLFCVFDFALLDSEFDHPFALELESVVSVEFDNSTSFTRKAVHWKRLILHVVFCNICFLLLQIRSLLIMNEYYHFNVDYFRSFLGKYKKEMFVDNHAVKSVMSVLGADMLLSRGQKKSRRSWVN